MTDLTSKCHPRRLLDPSKLTTELFKLATKFSIKLGLYLASSSFLKVLHVRGLLGGSKYFKMINPSNFISSLIVLDEKLDVLHVLELDKLQGDLLSIQLAP